LGHDGCRIAKGRRKRALSIYLRRLQANSHSGKLGSTRRGPEWPHSCLRVGDANSRTADDRLAYYAGVLAADL